MSAYDPIRVRALGLAHRLSFLYVPAWYLLSVPGGARLLSYAVWLMVPSWPFARIGLLAQCRYQCAAVSSSLLQRQFRS